MTSKSEWDWACKSDIPDSYPEVTDIVPEPHPEDTLGEPEQNLNEP